MGIANAEHLPAEPAALSPLTPRRFAGWPCRHADRQKNLYIRQETSSSVDRVVQRQAVSQAYGKIFVSVSGGRVHRTGTGFQGHVITKDDRHHAIIEWMMQLQALEFLTRTNRQLLEMLDAPPLRDPGNQVSRDDNALLTCADVEFNQGVIERSVKRDGLGLPEASRESLSI